MTDFDPKTLEAVARLEKLADSIERGTDHVQPRSLTVAIIRSVIAELAALREQTAASVDVLKHRYVNHDLLNMVEHNERQLVDLIETVCRLRGETDADADLKRFVHYIDHALDLSRGELSRIIDFAQGQKARADTATAELARQAPLVEAATAWATLYQRAEAANENAGFAVGMELSTAAQKMFVAARTFANQDKPE